MFTGAIVSWLAWGPTADGSPSDGSRPIYVSYVGGSENEFPEHRPFVNADGGLLLPGVTGSKDFPTTPGGCTYVGGSGNEMLRSVALGSNGELYLVGNTTSPDFPVTEGAAQTKYGGGGGDAFVIKLVPSGS